MKRRKLPGILLLFFLCAGFATAQQQSADVARLPLDPDRGQAAALRDILGLLDVSADSWPTEQWNALVTERLEVVAALWDQDAFPQGLSSLPWLDPDLPVTTLFAGDLEPVSAHGAWSVARRSGRGVGTPADVGIARSLASWRAAFDRDARLEYEVFDVRRAGEQVVTRIRLVATGHRGPARLQHNAIWTCSWRPTESGLALLALRSDALEVVALSGHAAGLFADATGSVFGDQGLFREQLAPGIEYWRTCIPAALEPGFLGHHGIAVGDVDGDGLEDLYLCQPGGLPNKLLLHLPGGGTRDVSSSAGVDFLDYSSNALLVDLDEDGDADLIVSTGSGLLFLANDGQAHFERKLLIERSLATSLAAADFDNDGDLDVYVCSYLSPYERQGLPTPYHDANNGEANTLMRNDRDWSFVDVTSQVGMDAGNRRFSFAAAWEDYDNDGDQDLYVANDFGRNNLYRNDRGRFSDVASELGVEDVSAGMGVTWGDVDGDGWMDLYISNMYSPSGSRLTSDRGFRPGSSPQTEEFFRHHARGNSLLLNEGGKAFTDASVSSGTSMGRWAWGALFLDFDNDGQLDLFSPNGFVTGALPADLCSYFWRQVVLRSPDGAGEAGEAYSLGWRAIVRLVRQGYSWNGNERHVALLNVGQSSFADVSSASGLDFTDDGRAAARVDWDGDGDQDLFVTNRTGPRIRFLSNQHDGTNHWVAFRLQGRTCNRSAIGARLVLATKGGRRMIRTLRCGEGFLAQSTTSLHFGLGADAVESVEVHWPGGEAEDFGRTPRDSSYLLEQGRGSASPIPPRRSPSGLVSSRPEGPVSSASARTVLPAPLPLPHLTLETTDGRSASLFGINSKGPQGTGHPLLMVLWGSFYQPCLRQLEALSAAAEDLRAAGIQVLAVGVDQGQDRRRALSMLEEIAWPFSIGFATEEAIGVLEVIQGTLHDSARTLAVPTSFLVDPGGRLIATYQGRLDPKHLRSDLGLFELSPEARRNAAVPFGGRWLAPASDTPNLEQVAARLAAGGLDRAAAEYRLAQIEVREFSAADFQFEAGLARQRQNQLDVAIRHFEKALEIEPGHFYAARNLAVALHQKGEHELALGAYRRALALEPGDAVTRFNLGLVFLALGDLAGARGELEALRALGSELAETLEQRIELERKTE